MLSLGGRYSRHTPRPYVSPDAPSSLGPSLSSQNLLDLMGVSRTPSPRVLAFPISGKSPNRLNQHSQIPPTSQSSVLHTESFQYQFLHFQTSFSLNEAYNTTPISIFFPPYAKVSGRINLTGVFPFPIRCGKGFSKTEIRNGK